MPTLPERFVEHVRGRPDALALVDPGQRWTYAEVDREASAWAERLAAAGVGRGDRVLLSMERSAAGVIALLGILRSGAAYVPVDPSHPPAWHDRVRADCDPAVVVGSWHGAGPAGVPVLAAADQAPGVAKGGATAAAAGPDDPMYIVYTSGSTGAPKGVCVTHANVARLFPAVSVHMAFGPDDRWALSHSLAFGFSVWEIWGAWCHGGALVVVPPSLTLSPRRLRAWLEACGVTVLSQTPTAFRQLASALADDPRPWAHLRWVAFSGEPLAPHLLAPWIDRFGDEQPRLANLYALTETSGEVAFHRVRRADREDGAGSCLGTPLPDVHLRLVDEAGHTLAEVDGASTGEACTEAACGELVVGGPAVAAGYWRRPELQAARFIERDGRREYRTGDRVRRSADGRLWFEGRMDRQVKLKGHRLELGAVEAALASHPGIRDAVVEVEPDPAGGERLVAYVQPALGNDSHDPPLGPQAMLLRTAPAQAIDPAWARHVGARLPYYAVPQRWVPVTAWPLTVNGKLDWAALRRGAPPVSAPPLLDGPGGLRAPATVSAPPGASLPPAPEALLEQIRRLWCEALDCDDLDPEDDFFDRGGHSLPALEVSLAVAEALGVQVSMTDLFETPTLGAYAALVARRLSLVPDGPDARSADASLLPEDDPDGPPLRLAIGRARQAMAEGQPPYAACLVGPDGAVLSVAHNTTLKDGDPTAHAEVQALRDAARRLGRTDLSGSVLYSTAEPCSMCLSAGVWAGVSRFVYAIDMEDERRFGLAEPTVPCREMLQRLRRPMNVRGGLLRREMHAVLEAWLRLQSVRA